MPVLRKRPISDNQDGKSGRLVLRTVRESITVSGATTADGTFTIPAGAIPVGGYALVETAISGTGVSTATVTIGDSATADGYLAASQLAVTVGSTAIFKGARMGAALATADTMTFAVGGTGSQAGKVRLVLHYLLPEVPSGNDDSDA